MQKLDLKPKLLQDITLKCKFEYINFFFDATGYPRKLLLLYNRNKTISAFILKNRLPAYFSENRLLPS